MSLKRLVLVSLLGPALVATAASAASTNPADLPGGHYVLDKKHASVIAKVMHLGVSLYTVRFDTFDATFTYDPGHPRPLEDYRQRRRRPRSTLAPTTAASSPTSSSTRPKTRGSPSSRRRSRPLPTDAAATMTGDLTLRGVTQPVTFNVTFVGVGRGLLPAGTVTGFSAVGHDQALGLRLGLPAEPGRRRGHPDYRGGVRQEMNATNAQTDPGRRYNAVAMSLHWLIALLILANIGLAWYFNGCRWFRKVRIHARDHRTSLDTRASSRRRPAPGRAAAQVDRHHRACCSAWCGSPGGRPRRRRRCRRA